MTPDWGVVGTVLSGLLLLAGTVLTIRSQRQKHRLDNTQQQYDQLQEDLGAARANITRLEARVDKLVGSVQSRDDYIVALRMHINNGQPPPPPPWPRELISPA